MKLTAFLGSPRAGGNTDIITEHVLRGAAEAGLETETVPLRKLRIRACTGCERCWQSSKPCVLEDDMSPMYDIIGASDVLLFATPVYWYAPTGIMKNFIDRLSPLNKPSGWRLVQGKAGILVAAYEEDGTEAIEPMLRMFELSFDYLRMHLIERIVATGLGPKGAVLQKPEILAAAYEVGRGLTRSWQQE